MIIQESPKNLKSKSWTDLNGGSYKFIIDGHGLTVGQMDRPPQ